MSRISNLLRVAAGLGAIAGIAACADVDRKLLLPANPVGGQMLSSYVALGNSITAGWQSGGLNDSVQQQSYARLFALQAQTRFAYPSFTKAVTVKVGTNTVTITTGCPPLLGNWVTQKNTDSLITGGTPGGCALRDASKLTDILNNVAVPFAYASDLLVTGSGVKIPVAPHTFILGGKAQVDRALDADPTFVSVWVGNNETLSPATVGMLTGLPSSGAPPLVSVADFSAAFNAAVDSLVRARPGLKGILFGAVRVANAPRFFPADSLGLSTSKRTAFQTFHGKGTTTIIGCGTIATGWLVSSELAKAIRAGTHPNVVSCVKNTPQAPIGDIFMIDPTELAAFNAATDGYNATISAKATALGWAYLDPNPILEAQKSGATPAIPAFPNFTANAGTRDTPNAVFGALFSLDGVHPSGAGQKIIANAMIDAVNAKYSLSIPKVP